MAQRSYNERELGPMRIEAEDWYSLSSVTRRRIVEICGGAAGIGFHIGAVQDALIAAQHQQMAARFMRAMQESLDRRRAARDEVQMVRDQAEWPLAGDPAHRDQRTEGRDPVLTMLDEAIADTANALGGTDD